MSFHAVIAFPFDADATLRAVLGQTRTGGIVSSPMEDLLLLCSSETDAVYVRCGLALRPASLTTFLVLMEDQLAVDLWLLQNGLAGRCEWAALEHLEFSSHTAVDRTIEVFSDIVGYDPQSLPLNLWPDVFRPNAALSLGRQQERVSCSMKGASELDAFAKPAHVGDSQ